jgi:hypothetical protein
MDDKWFFHQTSLRGDTMAEKWEESGIDKAMAFLWPGDERVNEREQKTYER